MKDHHYKEEEKLKKELVKAERDGNLKELSRIYHAIGQEQSDRGSHEEALETHIHGLNVNEARADELEIAISHRKVGESHMMLGDFRKAIKHQKIFLDKAKSSESFVEVQRAHATLGRTYLLLAESKEHEPLEQRTALDGALKYFNQSLGSCDKLAGQLVVAELDEMKARLHLNIGIVFDNMKDFQKAVWFFTSALKLSEKHKHVEDLYRCHISLAGLYERNGKSKEALTSYESAIKSAHSMKDRALEQESLHLKAMLLAKSDRLPECRKVLKRVYKSSKPNDTNRERIEKCLKIVIVICRNKESLDAIPEESFGQRATLCEKIADLAVKLENYGLAIEFYHKMLQNNVEFGYVGRELVPAYVSLAQTYADDRQYSQAEEYFRKELECHDSDLAQVVSSYLNIIDVMVKKAAEFSEICHVITDAEERAKFTPKLLLDVLRKKSYVQKLYDKKNEMVDTENAIDDLVSKEDIREDVEEEEEEEGTQSLADEESDPDLDDLSASEDDSIREENYDRGRCVTKRVHRNEKGETRLHRACIDNKISQVRDIVSKMRHLIPLQDHCGWTALHEAANHGHDEIIRILADAGANVNDRGGRKCSGITPLHDAASNGKVEAIRALVEKGANIRVKDDKGNTPYMCFKTHVNSVRGLSDEDKDMAREIGRLLTPAGQGNAPRSPSPPPSQPRRRSRYAQSHPDPLLPSSQETEEDSSQETFGEEDEEEETERSHRQPLIHDDISQLHNPRTTARSFKDAIASVGSRAKRAPHPTQQRSPSPRTRQALVNADDDVSDTWLVDDLGARSAQRPLGNVDNVFRDMGTQQKRKRRSSEGKTQTTQKRQRNPVISDSDDEVTSDVMGDTQRSHDQGHQDENRVACDVELLQDSQDFTCSPRMAPLSPPPLDFSISSQPDLPSSLPPLQSPRSPSPPPPLPSTNRLSLSRKPRSTQQTLSGFLHADSRHPATQSRTQAPAMTQQSQSVAYRGTGFLSQAQATMKINVLINDKIILVPVTESPETQNIAWLCQQAADRYYSIHNLRPLISLSTPEGAALAPHDLIASVLSSGDKVVASVEKWDLEPLQLRYKDACKTLKSVSYKNVCSRLQAADGTSVLNLQHLALKSAHFHPIAKALICQTSLKELNLAGNRIGDEGIHHLAVIALPTLPYLNVLDLSTNCISSAGIKKLADTLETTNPKLLQSLHTLVLSYNSLGDSWASSLIKIIKQLTSLTRLDVSSCDVMQRFFDQTTLLQQAFDGCRLSTINFAYNRLGPTGVELLCKSLAGSGIQNLDLSSTLGNNPGNLALRHVTRFVIRPTSQVTSLRLDSCNLGKESLPELIQCLRDNQTLRTLSLNNNPLIPSSTLKEIISASESSILQNLSLVGCATQTSKVQSFGRVSATQVPAHNYTTPPESSSTTHAAVNSGPRHTSTQISCSAGKASGFNIDAELLSALKVKLESAYPLQKLELSLMGKCLDVEAIKDTWLHFWGESGRVETSNNRLTLSVTDD